MGDNALLADARDVEAMNIDSGVPNPSTTSSSAPVSAPSPKAGQSFRLGLLLIVLLLLFLASMDIFGWHRGLTPQGLQPIALPLTPEVRAAEKAVEIAIGVAAYHDEGALAAYRITLDRVVTFLEVMKAPIPQVMSFQKQYTGLEGYVGQTDAESLRAIVHDGNMRELGAAIYVATDMRYLQDVFLYTLCRISAKNITSCDSGKYSEILVDGLGKAEISTPSHIPNHETIPSTNTNAFRVCPPDERTEEGVPLGLCVTTECLKLGKCPCQFPKPMGKEALQERARIYAGMGGKDKIGLYTLISRYKEVCNSMPEQYSNQFISMLYKYTLVRPGAGYLATCRVGDKMKHLDGVSDEELAAMQARLKSGAKDIKTDWTKAELDALSVPLSEREWAWQNIVATKDADSRLDWNIGAKAWKANPDGKIAHVDGRPSNRSNYARTRYELGLQVLNSPSGTTDQTLQIGLFMGLAAGSSALYDLRLGAIGYMLWAEHHSWDEMGVVGLPYGLKYESKVAFNFTTILGSAEKGAAFLLKAEASVKRLSAEAAQIGGVTLSKYNFSGAEAYFKAHARS